MNQELFKDILGMQQVFNIHEPHQRYTSSYFNPKINNSYFLLKNTYGTDDEFKKIHDGKHILFLGDSFTYGVGLKKEETWAHKVYSKIKEKEKVSGYYNLGTAGFDFFDSIDIFFKYCSEYSNPDVVFLLCTDIKRDAFWINNSDHGSKANVNKNNLLQFLCHSFYLFLEQYCKSNNIELYTFTWVNKEDERYKNLLKNNKNSFNENEQDAINTYHKEVRRVNKHVKQKINGETEPDPELNHQVLKNFNTFYEMDINNLLKKIYEYDQINKKTKRSIWAADEIHVGVSFHDAYADFIYEKYLINNDNTRN